MVFDFHNDILTSGCSKNYIIRAVKKNTDSRAVYVYWSTETKNNVLKRIKQAFKSIDFCIKKDFFAIEDLFFIEPEQILSLDIPLLYCGLTWNYDNALAGGAMGVSGLTNFGEQIIAELNAKKIIVDTAHLNEKSFYSVVEKADSVINSHTAINDIHAHARNLSYEQINLIIQKQGLVAITMVKDFIGGNTADFFVKQIDCFCEYYNIENLCIGTDFYGSTPLEGLHNYKDFVIIKQRLTNLGYTDENIDKIFYKNAENFIALHSTK